MNPFKWAAIVLLLVLVVFVATMALPVPSWRTGEVPRPPLEVAPPESTPSLPARVWVDTDAACGEGARTDPDDCFAILALARDPNLRIAGVSTVFGNATVDRTTAVATGLVESIAREGVGISTDGDVDARADDPASVADPLPVHPGSSRSLEAGGGDAIRPAHRALREALAAGPLTVVALGPLTNVAAVLDRHPALRSNVASLVAVMGKRSGHLFHPAEGSGEGMLFGHGPVFRDFNVAQDPEAVRRIVRTGVPLTLIPYEAAREVEITREVLGEMAEVGGAARRVSHGALDWWRYWNVEIGRGGFYPFDLLAAAYVSDPGAFRCAEVRAWTGPDPRRFLPFWTPASLLVTQDETEIGEATAVGEARYCPAVDEGMQGRLRRLLVSPATTRPNAVAGRRSRLTAWNPRRSRRKNRRSPA